MCRTSKFNSCRALSTSEWKRFHLIYMNINSAHTPQRANASRNAANNNKQTSGSNERAVLILGRVIKVEFAVCLCCSTPAGRRCISFAPIAAAFPWRCAGPHPPRLMRNALPPRSPHDLCRPFGRPGLTNWPTGHAHHAWYAKPRNESTNFQLCPAKKGLCEARRLDEFLPADA